MTLFSNIIEHLISLISHLGYFGVFIGMLIESSFIPFPSELVLPPAGVLVSRGEMSFLVVLFFAILGSILGALINYYIGLHFGRKIINGLVKKYGKFMLLKEESLKKADDYFKNHGSITTFSGRLIPAIRQLISIPAGFSRMSLSKFIFYTSLGAGIWSAILIYVGFLYGNNQESINSFLSSTTIIVLISLVVLIIGYLYLKKRISKVNS